MHGLEDKLELLPQRVEAIDLAYNHIDKQERLKDYRNDISDHVPIKITIEIKNVILCKIMDKVFT